MSPSKNLRSRLSVRIGIHEINEIVLLTKDNNRKKQELFNLLFDEEDIVSYQASWVLCHFGLTENRWLFTKQDELINEVFACTHPGKRRQLLHLLYKQPMKNPPRVDFLDYCLEHMMSQEEAYAVNCLCMKLAYELCREIPELLQEFRSLLDLMQADLLPVSLQSVRKNLLKAMDKGKSLQKY